MLWGAEYRAREPGTETWRLRQRGSTRDRRGLSPRCVFPFSLTPITPEDSGHGCCTQLGDLGELWEGGSKGTWPSLQLQGFPPDSGHKFSQG